MKKRYIIVALIIAYAVSALAGQAINNKDHSQYAQELLKYFMSQKKQLENSPIDNGKALSWFSWWYGKGSVTTEEVKLVRSISEEEFRSLAQTVDWPIVEKKARDFVEKIVNEHNDIKKDSNKWHELLYQDISVLNSEKLGYEERDRKAVVAKMLKQNDTEAHQAFVNGIAITKTVEDLMSNQK